MASESYASLPEAASEHPHDDSTVAFTADEVTAKFGPLWVRFTFGAGMGWGRGVEGAASLPAPLECLASA